MATALADDAPDPYLRVVVGAPVYTRDEQRIGTVKEVRGRLFKVDAPLRRDFWLNGDCVATALGDGGVMLSVHREALSAHRVMPPPN